MKKYLLLIAFILTLPILAGCDEATKTPTSEETINQIYTSVAGAFMTEEALSTEAATILPTTTPTSQSTATLIPSITPKSTTKVVSSGTTSYSASTCDNSVYVSDVTIPDGTILAPGESFTKTWSLENTGTCMWTTAYAIAYKSGSSMSGATTYVTTATGSSGTVSMSVAMVAPTTTGTYTGYWQMVNASGISFGSSVYVQIVVSDSASTLTPTITATSDESTYTSTPTTAPTETPVPTAVPTETPTTASSTSSGESS